MRSRISSLMFLLPIAGLVVISTGCSIYKSSGRDDFNNTAAAAGPQTQSLKPISSSCVISPEGTNPTLVRVFHNQDGTTLVHITKTAIWSAVLTSGESFSAADCKFTYPADLAGAENMESPNRDNDLISTSQSLVEQFLSDSTKSH